MKRVIVDYSKLTDEILTLLVEKFPDGYDDSNIVRFRNAQNELIEAVEVRTSETIYLVKVSTKLANRLENIVEEEEGELDDVATPIDNEKPDGIEVEDDDDALTEDEDEEEVDVTKDPGGSDDDEASDDDDDDDYDEDDDYGRPARIKEKKRDEDEDEDDEY